MCKIIHQNSSTTFFTSSPEMLTIYPPTFYVPNFHHAHNVVTQTGRSGYKKYREQLQLLNCLL